MLKFEGHAVGVKIRAEDFEPCEGRETCWIEGTIVAVDVHGSREFPFAHYLIEVTRDVWRGQDVPPERNTRVGRRAAVPFEVCMLDWDSRVSVIQGAPCVAG